MNEIDEIELLSAFRRGVAIEGSPTSSVSAAVLRRCCHELRHQIDPRGLQLKNVAIAGRLDLAGLTVTSVDGKSL